MMEIEDNFCFYRADNEPNFYEVWTQIVENPNYLDSCDVRIECFDGYYCHSHQNLLSITSSCFREAFHYYYFNRTEELALNEELVISLPQFITSQELESIIVYIYNGFVSVPESRVNQFLKISEFLGIKGLENIVLVYENEM